MKERDKQKIVFLIIFGAIMISVSIYYFLKLFIWEKITGNLIFDILINIVFIVLIILLSMFSSLITISAPSILAYRFIIDKEKQSHIWTDMETKLLFIVSCFLNLMIIQLNIPFLKTGNNVFIIYFIIISIYITRDLSKTFFMKSK
jgi:hypothetical protein